MFFFIVRRLLIAVPILFASSLLTFWLVTLSGDPLDELRTSRDPNREQIMAQLRSRLELDTPFFERYWSWLSGIVRGDFGLNRDGQDVSTLLSQAVGTTFRLVIIATVASIVLGLIVGVISAVRQYSLIDYTSTFAAFLFFSLPVFWLAVLLKEFGAIRFNEWLEAPGLSVAGIVILTALAALFVGGLVGGTTRRRAIAAGATAVVSVVGLAIIDATDWMLNPGLSFPVIVVLSLAGGVLAALIYAPIGNQQVLLAGVGAAIVGLIGAVAFDSWIEDMSWTRMFLLAVFSLLAGAATGALLGGAIDRRAAVQAGMTSSIVVGHIIVFDQFVSAWEPGRTIATIGPKTPNLDAPFWETMVDYAGHQVLPSLALILIGFATYMRFTRASMLDTLKSDYVRTAKAKGLPATQVIMRHAFRTALIPVMTVITISFAAVIDGAIITERVFGWKGMGSLFIDGLNDIDPYPVMGFVVVTSISVVLLNAVADILYAYLDPRIRR
jgi:peptide/nickel transport system permease protein